MGVSGKVLFSGLLKSVQSSYDPSKYIPVVSAFGVDPYDGSMDRIVVRYGKDNSIFEISVRCRTGIVELLTLVNLDPSYVREVNFVMPGFEESVSGVPGIDLENIAKLGTVGAIDLGGCYTAERAFSLEWFQNRALLTFGPPAERPHLRCQTESVEFYFSKDRVLSSIVFYDLPKCSTSLIQEAMNRTD